MINVIAILVLYSLGIMPLAYLLISGIQDKNNKHSDIAEDHLRA
jgi:hypothetical protein